MIMCFIILHSQPIWINNSVTYSDTEKQWSPRAVSIHDLLLGDPISYFKKLATNQLNDHIKNYPITF